MSRFFVGQRVRLVKPENAECIGMTGRISELFPERKGLSYLVNCELHLDQRVPDWIVPQTHTDRIEPILQDGHELVEIEQLLNVLPELEHVFAQVRA